MQSKIAHFLHTDVVVVGSGAAGVRAAIEARRHEVEVLIVSASRIGHANNSAISHGGFSTSMCQTGDSPERLCEDTIKGGSGLNRPFLVRMLSYDISTEVASLEKMGVVFRRIPDGSYAFEGRGGHSVARRLTTPHSSGMELLLPVLRIVKESSIKTLGGVKAVFLLQRDGCACGILGINRRGEWICVSAKAVVLATGGGGALYSKNTNVPWASGGGYALAYEAGLVLQDMEFVQFVLWHMKDPGVPSRIPPAEVFLLSGADLLNGKGCSLMKDIGSLTRDSISQVVARAIEEEYSGSEGFVYLDLKNLRNNELYSIPNLRAERIRVFPAAHFFMGGVRVDENLGTSIEGLYVAGETMGGVHGANRLGGNALAEAFVFGRKAGFLAAMFAKKCSADRISVSYAVRALEKKAAAGLSGVSRRSISPDISKLIEDLKALVATHAGVLRNKSKLDSGLLAVETLRNTSSQLPSPKTEDLWDWFELWHCLTVAEMIFRSSLERKESRGAHYRDDYPYTDNEKWLVNVCTSKSNQGAMKLRRVPVSTGSSA